MNPKTPTPSGSQVTDEELIELVERVMRQQEARYPGLQAKQERLVQMIKDGTFFARPADMTD